MGKIARNLFALAVSFVICYFLFIRGPVGLLRVTSGSMEPALEVGDVCLVDKITDFSKLQKGELVVFYYGNQSKACHRIIEKRKDGYITKGDANSTADIFLLTENNYYGRVVFTI